VRLATSWRVRLIPAAVIAALLTAVFVSGAAAADFRSDWALEKGLALEIDSRGYELPTAIAFVPDPGRLPKSPLYFVVELRGAVKVVTRDRTVVEYADVGITTPPERYPAIGAQNGAAGICLDPEHGYVFVTYSAFDARGVLRNHLVRFSSAPRTFSVTATGRKELGRPFTPYPTNSNHQIGGCAVDGDSVYIGVGDGAIAARAQDLDKLSGKIVRMTLDGEPHPDNPFFGTGKPRRYVYAYGLRNPFGLALADGRLFATQNGGAIDSFLAIERGRNYGWDGTDPSIAINAAAVFIPTVAPVHLAYVPERSSLFPAEYGGTFFFGSAQSAAERGAGVLALPYDLQAGRVTAPARNVVRFRRKQGGEVAAVALGPDGLYFAPIVPNVEGETPVYRVRSDPAEAYPYALDEGSGFALFQRFGCRGCHQIDNVGGATGPPLDQPLLERRITERLASPDYMSRLDQIDELDGEPFRSTRPFREALRNAAADERVALWLKYRVLEPRFDDPQASMPTLGLDDSQAEAIVDYLLVGEAELAAPPQEQEFTDRVRRVATSKRFAGGAVIGFAAASLLFGFAWLARRKLAAGS
jgi:glucose/arabinose dehydrogenase